jgi:hypothetical protein
MQKIINLIFHHTKTKPPKQVLGAFVFLFGKTKNIEWQKEGDNFEALFYKNGTEQIALFSHEGILLEKKCNLMLKQVTPAISARAEEIGELMNLIEIDRGGSLFYEIIARDKNLERYSLLLGPDGDILEKRKL